VTPGTSHEHAARRTPHPPSPKASAGRRRTRRRDLHALVLVIALVFTGWPIFAQTPAPAPGALTLDAALALAMSGNLTIAAARLRRPVDVAGIGVADERPNPEFTVESTRETPRQAFSALFPIELGGKRQARVGLATAAVTTGEAETDRIIALVRSDVRRAYFEVVAAERRVTAATESRDVARRVHDTAQTSFGLGEKAQIDVYLTDVDLAVTENDVTGAQSELTATHAELNTLLGRAPGAPLQLADELVATPLPPLEALVARASADNADLRVLDRGIAEQNARLGLARALRAPDVSVGGGVTFNAQPDFSLGYRAAFTMTVPLFTHHDAGVAVENAELTRLGGERAALIAGITGAVAAARARAEGAREQLARFQSDILPGAARVAQMQEAAYRAGQTNVNVLLEALKSAADLRAKAIEAGLDYQRALADLERALGVSIK
jgi:cobalt-zinc-cadmium efflux system outer membrane protein